MNMIALLETFIQLLRVAQEGLGAFAHGMPRRTHTELLKCSLFGLLA